MNICADELLMSSRFFNPSVLPLIEADRQRSLRIIQGVEGIYGTQLILEEMMHAKISLLCRCQCYT